MYKSTNRAANLPNNPAEAARLAGKLSRRSTYSVMTIIQGYPFPGIELKFSEQLRIAKAELKRRDPQRYPSNWAA
jgi:hypothetical protein